MMMMRMLVSSAHGSYHGAVAMCMYVCAMCMYVCAGEILDAGAIKRMLLSFEKKVLRNQEMRVKFPDIPDKFMESELELNDEIQKLHVIATVPEYYPILIETNAIQTILGLLSHDNSDVSIAVIDLLQELTDEEAVAESEDELEVLADTLLAEGVSEHVSLHGGILEPCLCR